MLSQVFYALEVRRLRRLDRPRDPDRPAAIKMIPQDAARRAFLRYGKGHAAALDLGDCAVYALAKSHALPLLFKGNDFPHTDLISSL